MVSASINKINSEEMLLFGEQIINARKERHLPKEQLGDLGGVE